MTRTPTPTTNIKSAKRVLIGDCLEEGGCLIELASHETGGFTVTVVQTERGGKGQIIPQVWAFADLETATRSFEKVKAYKLTIHTLCCKNQIQKDLFSK